MINGNEKWRFSARGVASLAVYMVGGLIVSGSVEAADTSAKPTSSAARPVAPAASAGPATVTGKRALDMSKSTVSATFRQEGAAVEGQFRKFTAMVDFDSTNPAATKAQVEIDMTSFDLGDPSYNAELGKKEWFNAAQYPRASFVSTSAKAGVAGKLDVAGKLTIKGKATDISFPVTYRHDGASTVFEGSVPVKRSSFSIGEGEWKDTSVVEDEVRIKFKLTLLSGK